MCIRVLFLRFLGFCIRLYLYMSSVILRWLPKYIWLKTFVHKTKDTSFVVNEYIYNHKNTYSTIKFIDIPQLREIDCKKNTESLFHISYVVDDDGCFIKDITQDIKSFLHLLDKIEWKYILIHLELTEYPGIVFVMDDDDFTEKQLVTKDIMETYFSI